MYTYKEITGKSIETFDVREANITVEKLLRLHIFLQSSNQVSTTGPKKVTYPQVNESINDFLACISLKRSSVTPSNRTKERRN